MTNLSASFAPDWVSPPGETILDISEERGWSQSELAKRLGFSEKHLSLLANGRASLTKETAEKLERVLGGSVDFWLSREANYQAHKSRIEAANRNSLWEPWLEEVPVKDLMNCGAIEKLRIIKKHKSQIVESCLKFFGVASPDEWRSIYGGMQVSFRRSREEQCDVGAISSWLRIGEMESESIEAPKFNKSKFEKALKEIRALTTEDAEVFEPRMRRLLLESGVILVLVPAMPRSHVSGVARWINPSRPLIQLSLYGKSNDKFWFTFFHEAAHILLHSDTKEDKKSIFLDDPNATRSQDKYEIEANEWAGNFLIPEKYNNCLPDLKSREAVIQFSRAIGIHPGIVIGRLQHDGHIQNSWMNDLKQGLQFRK
ncbi:TPA: helix-turn-helix domain-containing protein [Proteus mirabilis]|nr:helix-turn-helix domain-containing protein [Proteus mirabilis]